MSRILDILIRQKVSTLNIKYGIYVRMMFNSWVLISYIVNIWVLHMEFIEYFMDFKVTIFE